MAGGKSYRDSRDRDISTVSTCADHFYPRLSCSRIRYPRGLPRSKRHSGMLRSSLAMPRLRQLQAVAVALLPLVVGATTSSNTALETKNYIDTISGYVELSTCAAEVLSTIVRAQSSGCGDNGALTSYTCFCTDSSSQFSYEISSAVMTSCDSSVATAQASSALAVFDGYCALGVEAGLSTTAVCMSIIRLNTRRLLR